MRLRGKEAEAPGLPLPVRHRLRDVVLVQPHAAHAECRARAIAARTELQILRVIVAVGREHARHAHQRFGQADRGLSVAYRGAVDDVGRRRDVEQAIHASRRGNDDGVERHLRLAGRGLRKQRTRANQRGDDGYQESAATSSGGAFGHVRGRSCDGRNATSCSIKENGGDPKRIPPLDLSRPLRGTNSMRLRLPDIAAHILPIALLARRGRHRRLPRRTFPTKGAARSASSTRRPTRSRQPPSTRKSPAASRCPRTAARLYLSDQTANALVVVDTAKGQVIATIPLGDSPEAIYLSPDGKWLSAAIEENDQVIIVDTAALKVDRRIRMKGKNPEHAVWSPDGRWLYVSAEEADSVDIVDIDKERGREVGEGRRPSARHRFPARRQPRVRRRGERRYRQRVRHRHAGSHRPDQGRRRAPMACSCIRTASACS